MKGARKRVKAFANSVVAAARTTAKLGAAVGTVAAGGLTLLTRNAMKNIDAVSKLSDSLGISTEALVAFQHAGEITGVKTEGMNKALTQFVRRIGEAQTGTGEASDALDRLGLSGEQLAQAGPAEAFKIVAEAINKLPDATSKAEAAYRLFGRQGVALVNTLALGREGLAEMAKETVLFGTSIDRIGGAKVEAFNDSFTRTKEIFVGIGQTLAVNLAPFLTVLSDKFRAAATAGEGVGAKVVNAFNFVLTSIGKAADWLELLQAGFYTLRGVANSALLGIVGTINFLAQKVGDFLEYLGVDAGKGFLSIMDASIRDFAADIEDDFKLAGDAMKKFLGGESAKAVGVVFKRIRDDAQATAEAVAEAAKKRQVIDVAGVATTAEALAKPTGGQQQRMGFGRSIDLSTTSIAGLAMAGRKVQKVEGVKDKEIASTLKSIERNTKEPTVAMVS
jgi:hypothetical protein